MQLSEHFTLREMTRSDQAVRLGIDNTPDTVALNNLKRLAQVMEVVRFRLGGYPIRITSGYRSRSLNAAIGGSPTSAHPDGRADDFDCDEYGTPLEICHKISEMDIEFDQLIHEFGEWVHLGIAPLGQKPRRQLLTARRENGRTVYVVGLHPV